MPKRVFVYAEDMPVERDVVAHGLHRASAPILRCISDYLQGIVIYPVGHRYHDFELDQLLVHLCTSLPPFPTLLCKALRRFTAPGLGFADSLPARLLSPIVGRSDADILFCFVGSDIGTLSRAAKLANLAGKAYAFYLVDDFVLPLRLAGMRDADIRRAVARAGSALRGALHIFTITDGLGERLRQDFDVSTTTLPLAFEAVTRPLVEMKNQVIFVGSINFLYAGGLQDLIKVVGGMRDRGADMTIRLTVSAQIARVGLGELPQFVICGPLETSKELAQEIAASLIAFLPYSFDLRHRTMVSTSFPSKSMEYLAHARSILVYGPDYGVATKYFRDAGLPTVVSSPEGLEQAIFADVAIRPDYSDRYREYLAREHSLKSARRTLCTELDLDQSPGQPRYPSLEAE